MDKQAIIAIVKKSKHGSYGKPLAQYRVSFKSDLNDHLEARAAALAAWVADGGRNLKVTTDIVLWEGA